MLSGQENDVGNWFLLGNNSFQKVSIHQNVNDLVFVNVIVALEIELKCLTTFLSLNSDHYNFVMVSLPKKSIQFSFSQAVNSSKDFKNSQKIKFIH